MLITPPRAHKTREMLPKAKDETTPAQEEEESNLLTQFCGNKVRTFCFGCLSETFPVGHSVEIILTLFWGKGGKSRSPAAV